MQPGKVTILKSTLENELYKILGTAVIFDTINNHKLEPDGRIGRTVGTVLAKIRDVMDLEELKLKGVASMEVWRRIENLKWEINNLVRELPEVEIFIQGELTCSWAELYEAVAGCLKTHLLDLQANLKKLSKCRRDWIISKLKRMEELFGLDSDQVTDSLLELNRFDDEQLKENANKYRDFFHKNNEKPTRAFCLLGRENNVLDDTEQIKDQNGDAFANNKVRSEFMKGYYEGLYKKKLDNLIRIEDFLSHEVSNSEWVLSRKLDMDERNSLEGNVTLEELDKALKTSNLQSSNGWDGISYILIKRFFEHLGILIVNMANECFLNGELTSTFRMGLIKLIPKKGNASKIEDWRPITLLCCGYKLVSGVVALRLERYLKKLIGMSQKGFLRFKNMNTCTINIMDRIALAWDKKEAMGVLCIDFVKAFDSIEHEYIKNVLRFFNFGPNFVNMVGTLINKRTARIIVDGGYSDTFEIGRGTPQGDRSSPYLFLLCIEVLLMKIKSETGVSLKNCETVGEWLEQQGIGGEGLSEGFADDLTAMFKLENGVVETLIRILNNFSFVSGLSLNVKKTQLMVVGTDDYPVGSKIAGIDVVEKVKILGMIIDRKLVMLDDNWENGIRKVEKMINFWKLQRLSLTGRILVAKSYMLSQVIFLLSTLHLEINIGDRINSLLANFVKGSDRLIARSRWHIDRTLGGYGLIDVHVLGTCLKANWINRWILNEDTIDINGRRAGIDLNTPVDQWGVGKINKVSDPTVYGIMTEWKNFKRLYYRVAGNFGNAHFFLNDGLLEGRPNLGQTIFGNERFNSLNVVAKLVKIKEMYHMGRFKTKEQIGNLLGINMNLAEYFRCRNILEEMARNFGTYETASDADLDDFMRTKKRTGGMMRRLILGKKSESWKQADPRKVPSVRTLWGENVVTMDRDIIEMNMGAWGNGKLSSDFREFLFNMVQGRLYLNNALANFVDRSSKCTFCTKVAKGELESRGIDEQRAEYNYFLNLLPRETLKHFFWECEHVQPLVQQCYRYMMGLNWLRGGERIEEVSFIVGSYRPDKKLMEADLMWKNYLKFYIYKCRYQNRLPTFPFFRCELENMMNVKNLWKVRNKMLSLKVNHVEN